VSSKSGCDGGIVAIVNRVFTDPPELMRLTT
jgi:hypothetical protein